LPPVKFCFAAKPYQIRLKSDVLFYLTVIKELLEVSATISIFLRKNLINLQNGEAMAEEEKKVEIKGDMVLRSTGLGATVLFAEPEKVSLVGDMIILHV
jgi:hypothetical protein